MLLERGCGGIGLVNEVYEEKERRRKKSNDKLNTRVKAGVKRKERKENKRRNILTTGRGCMWKNEKENNISDRKEKGKEVCVSITQVKNRRKEERWWDIYGESGDRERIEKYNEINENDKVLTTLTMVRSASVILAIFCTTSAGHIARWFESVRRMSLCLYV